MLSVTVYTEDAEGDLVPEQFSDIKYVSFVNDDTFGPPPLIAPQREQKPTAQVGEDVLYINTRLVPLFQITRTADHG